jgi:hypothetical protein
MFCFVQGDRIEIREILWGTSWAFSLVQPPLFHVVGMKWAQPQVFAGDRTQLRFAVANPYNGQPTLETFLVDSLGVETPVSAESLGFYTVPSFTADTTNFEWYARRFPAVPDSDTVTVTRLRIRTVDRTCASDILTIRARAYAAPDTTPVDPPPTDDGGGGGDAPPDWLGDRGMFRSLTGSPLGPGPAFVVQLPSASDVRVDLFDLLGRRVRNLASRSMPQGTTVLPWDGRGDDGVSQARGVYFARMSAGPHVKTVRVLWLPH